MFHNTLRVHLQANFVSFQTLDFRMQDHLLCYNCCPPDKALQYGHDVNRMKTVEHSAIYAGNLGLTLFTNFRVD